MTTPRVPKPATLRRYGLTVREWKAILKKQGDVCAICRMESKTGRLCTDHEHVKDWKKMPPEERKLFVRGVVCWRCNHYYLGKGITIFRADNVAAYLRAYEKRRPART